MELEGYLAAHGYWLEGIADCDSATAAGEMQTPSTGVGYGKTGDVTLDAVQLIQLSEELERVHRKNVDFKKNTKLQADIAVMEDLCKVEGVSYFNCKIFFHITSLQWLLCLPLLARPF